MANLRPVFDYLRHMSELSEFRTMCEWCWIICFSPENWGPGLTKHKYQVSVSASNLNSQLITASTLAALRDDPRAVYGRHQ